VIGNYITIHIQVLINILNFDIIKIIPVSGLFWIKI